MSIIDIHAPHQGLEITMEIPYNSLSVELRDVARPEIDITLYLPLDQWALLRKVFPKAASYSMHKPGRDIIRDHAEADAYAEEFYAAEMAKLITDMPPEAPGTDDIVDEVPSEQPAIGVGYGDELRASSPKPRDDSDLNDEIF